MTELDKMLQELKEEVQRLRKFNAMLEEELKGYRELDEKGLLLKLPCKVGDKAYHVIKDEVAVPPIYISEHEITDVSANAVYFADDWWNFEEMQGMNAFLTKAEAKKALAEMEEQA